jgi:hypothetical protein
MIRRSMTDSPAIAVSDDQQTLRTLGKGKPLLYLPDDRSAPVPEVVNKLAQSRLIIIPLPGSDADSQSLALLLNGSDAALCDVIACGRATDAALNLAGLYSEMIDKIVIDTPLVARGFTDRVSPAGLAAQMLIVIGDRAPQASVESALALKRKFERSHLAYVYEATNTVIDSQPGRYETVVFDFLERGVAFVLKPDKFKASA